MLNNDDIELAEIHCPKGKKTKPTKAMIKFKIKNFKAVLNFANNQKLIKFLTDDYLPSNEKESGCGLEIFVEKDEKGICKNISFAREYKSFFTYAHLASCVLRYIYPYNEKNLHDVADFFTVVNSNQNEWEKIGKESPLPRGVEFLATNIAENKSGPKKLKVN